VHVPPWLADDPTASADLAAFQGAIRALDTGIGRILRALDETGLAENTIVLFFSDHGMPYPRAKHSLYEPGCAAAALVRWPAGGWSGGCVIDTPLSGVDVLPTLLDAARVELPENVQGRSFRALLEGTNAAGATRAVVFTEQNFNAYSDVSRAVRAGRHKLMAHFTPGRAFYDSTQLWHPPARVPFIEDQPRTQHPSVELYDLGADPLETTNLASDPAAAGVLAELSALLLGWMEETCDPLLDGLPVPPLYQRTMTLLRSGGRT